MPCYFPITAYRSLSGRSPTTGKWPIVFKVRDGYHDLPVIVPCGRCIGCRLKQSREWAARCLHEASLHTTNVFLTLTYDNEHLPSDSGLSKRDLQLFWKRLRKYYGNESFRYYACGEYGARRGRPHYHAIVFGLDIVDKTLYNVSRGNNLYVSDVVRSIWGNGLVIIGEVNFQSAAYVARYCLKKSGGAYESDTRQKEFTVMSRKPGIANAWIQSYSSSVYAVDQIIVQNGLRLMPPKYYDNIYDKIDHQKMEQIRKERRVKGVQRTLKGPEIDLRRAYKEKVLQIKRLKRSYEHV